MVDKSALCAVRSANVKMFLPLLVFGCFRAVCGDSAFSGSLDRAEVRKKDAPVAPQAVLAMLEMQERQAARIAAYQRDGKRRVVLARSNATLLRDRAEWLVPCEHESYQESHAYSSIANCTPTTCRRIVRDGFATAPEAALLAAATEMAMVNLFHQGGTTSLVPDSQGGPRLGVPAHRLVQDLQDRARRQIEDDFLLNSEENISRPLIFNSGAMLTRLKAEHVVDEWEVNPNHVYWNAHVDKANIASYDYSALLYLNTHVESPPPGSTNQGQEQMSTAFTNAPAHSAINGDLGFFEGGEFAFIDEDADRVVQPLAGRLVTFSSGLENLHRVEQVTRGTRYVLAMWFTCSEAHRYKDKADLGGDGGEGQEGRAIADHGQGRKGRGWRQRQADARKVGEAGRGGTAATASASWLWGQLFAAHESQAKADAHAPVGAEELMSRGLEVLQDVIAPPTPTELLRRALQYFEKAAGTVEADGAPSSGDGSSSSSSSSSSALRIQACVLGVLRRATVDDNRRAAHAYSPLQGIDDDGVDDHRSHSRHSNVRAAETARQATACFQPDQSSEL